MIKAAFKSLAAGVVYHTGLLNLVRPSSSGRSAATILMYHRVLPHDSPGSLNKEWERYRSLPGIVVTPEMFEAQLKFLSGRYKVISLAQLINCFEAGTELSERTAVITFDDGWRDNYDYAFPILKKFGMPATIFLTAGYIDTTDIFWPERVIGSLSSSSAVSYATADLRESEAPPVLAGLIASVMNASGSEQMGRLDRLVNAMKELAPDDRESWLKKIEAIGGLDRTSKSGVRVMLDWREIGEMQAGGISFGSHGISHELLTNIDRPRAQQELVESKRMLEARLNCPVDTLAYPNGNFNEEVKQLAREAGYRCAVSVLKEHVTTASDRFALGRINIHDGCSRGVSGRCSPALFACHLQKFPG